MTLSNLLSLSLLFVVMSLTLVAADYHDRSGDAWLYRRGPTIEQRVAALEQKQILMSATAIDWRTDGSDVATIYDGAKVVAMVRLLPQATAPAVGAAYLYAASHGISTGGCSVWSTALDTCPAPGAVDMAVTR